MGRSHKAGQVGTNSPHPTPIKWVIDLIANMENQGSCCLQMHVYCLWLYTVHILLCQKILQTKSLYFCYFFSSSWGSCSTIALGLCTFPSVFHVDFTSIYVGSWWLPSKSISLPPVPRVLLAWVCICIMQYWLLLVRPLTGTYQLPLLLGGISLGFNGFISTISPIGWNHVPNEIFHARVLSCTT